MTTHPHAKLLADLLRVADTHFYIEQWEHKAITEAIAVLEATPQAAEPQGWITRDEIATIIDPKAMADKLDGSPKHPHLKNDRWRARQKADTIIARSPSPQAAEGEEEAFEAWKRRLENMPGQPSPTLREAFLSGASWSASHSSDSSAEIERLTAEYRRAIDHLRSWAESHPDERTSETDAIFYCVAQALRGDRRATQPPEGGGVEDHIPDAGKMVEPRR